MWLQKLELVCDRHRWMDGQTDRCEGWNSYLDSYITKFEHRQQLLAIWQFHRDSSEIYYSIMIDATKIIEKTCKTHD